MNIKIDMKFPDSALLRCFVFVGSLWLGALVILADTHYVTPPGGYGTNNPPYTNWADAATNIQWAVDVAASGETVLVTNGTYCLTNQIFITNNITVQSVNGWTNTLVYADWPAWTTRCFYVANTGAVLDGFTVSNGYIVSSGTNGGAGAFVSNGIIRNCYFVKNVVTNTDNMYYSGGGGIYFRGEGIISNCTFFTNSVFSKVSAGSSAGGGGALYIYADGTLNVLNSAIVSNTVYDNGLGGGIYIANSGSPVVSNCVISFNSVSSQGGGMLVKKGLVTDSVFRKNSSRFSTAAIHLIPDSSQGTINNCLITENICSTGSPALFLRYSYAMVSNCVITGNVCSGVSMWENGLLRNCLICNNSNAYVVIIGGGVTVSKTNAGVVNCTVANNYTAFSGGGILVYSSSNYIVNSIIANNTAPSNSDIYCYDLMSTNNFYYCCVNTNLVPGQGNITNDQQFVDAAGGNYRLRPTSPCVNTGTNQDWMTNGVDLDGRMRIRYRIVDMGAYECIYEGTIFMVP